jgi:anti-sigma B factor antagonist
MRGNGSSGLPLERDKSAEPSGSAAAAGTKPEAPAYAIIQHEPETGLNVLAAEGELDLASAPSLKWALTDVLGDGGRRIVVDLSNVTFIDSTALGVLVGVYRSLPVGARLGIVCTHDEVMNIFELTGLDATFDIFSSLDDALAFVRGSAAAAG